MTVILGTVASAKANSSLAPWRMIPPYSWAVPAKDKELLHSREFTQPHHPSPAANLTTTTAMLAPWRRSCQEVFSARYWATQNSEQQFFVWKVKEKRLSRWDLPKNKIQLEHFPDSRCDWQQETAWSHFCRNLIFQAPSFLEHTEGSLAALPFWGPALVVPQGSPGWWTLKDTAWIPQQVLLENDHRQQTGMQVIHVTGCSTPFCPKDRPTWLHLESAIPCNLFLGLWISDHWI